MFCKRKTGFTLIELVVVMAIAALLSAILLPVFGNVRENSRQTGCISNLHSILIALKVYALDNSGTLPPASPDYAGRLYSGGYIDNLNAFKCPNDYMLVDAGGVDLTTSGVERLSYNKYVPVSSTLLNDTNSLSGWHTQAASGFSRDVPYPFCGAYAPDHTKDTGSEGAVMHGSRNDNGAGSIYLAAFADGTVRKYRNNSSDMPTAMK